MGKGTLRRSMFVSFILLSTIPDFIQPCIYLLNQGWKQKSVGERAKLVTVVFTGKVRRLYPLNEVYQTYAADFDVLRVLKGRDSVDEVMSVHHSEQLKVFGFGEKRSCLSPVRLGEIHMVFALHSPRINTLVARYDDIFGATSSATKENEDEVMEALGWRSWSSWTQCTDDCGGGLQWRSRKCSDQGCEGKTKERRRCNSFECYGVKDVTHYIREAENKIAGHLIEKRKMIKLEESKFLSLPTTRVFRYYFPDKLSIIITFRPIVFLDLYLLAIYDVAKTLQLGIRIIPDTVVFEFQESKLIFQVNMELGHRHSLAFSVQGEQVSLFWNCQKTQTESLPEKFSFTPDPAGIMYFGKPPYSELKERFEVELSELHFVPDPLAAKQKCQVSHFVSKSNSKVPEGSGGELHKPDGEDGSGTTNYVDDHDSEVEMSWSEWSPCSQTCGKGIRKRVMVCDFELNMEPDDECLKALQTEEVKECHLMECPAYCDRPCLNGGFCQRRNTCKCQSGYHGNSCEKVRCQVICLNGGTCIGPFKCRCPPGYSGTQCEKAVCSPPCEHGGTCIHPNVCRCPSGYSPPSCQPSCHPPCFNGGKCVGPNTCLCPRMFTGTKCKQAVCSRSCLNGGRCYAPDKCSCSYGWQGKRCDQARCFPQCKNGGQCMRPNVCRCPRGAFGFYCQYRRRH